MKHPYIKTTLGLLITLLLSACSASESHSSDAASAVSDTSTNVKKEITIGTSAGDFADMVVDQIQPTLEKEGYTVKLIQFSDYVRPNIALADKDIDINIFQHKPYLDQFKKEHNLDIIPAFQVPTAPLGIYSGKLKTLVDVKEGSSVSIPNDPSNLARALVMLDQLGWIKLQADIDPLTASTQDIAENTKKLKLVTLEAAQLPRSRQDVDFAVINGNYATNSGIKLTESLFQEPSFAYVNWAAIRTADQNEQWVKDITNAYNSNSFKDYAKQRFTGYKYPAQWGDVSSNPNTATSEANH